MCACVPNTGKIVCILWVLAVYGVCNTLSSDFEPGGKPQIKLLNPDAEVVIGSVLSIRERGSGLFGCGERRHEGVLKADALKWMINELNNKLWSGQSANVSFGLYLMDSCDRIRTATSQLVEFLPELQSDRMLNSSYPFKFCLIDDVGLDNEADIQKSLKDIDFPVVKTTVNSNSPQALTNAIYLFLQEMHWERFAIIHSSSKFGLAMLKQFTKLMKKSSDFCVPWMVNIDDEDPDEIRRVFESGVPILSLLPTEEQEAFLMHLKYISDKKKVEILFADSVNRSQLKMVPTNRVQVFAVVPLPNRDPSFESYYSKNSIESGVRTEDELDLLERTKTIRKVKAIGDKLSEILIDTIENVCRAGERLCGDLLGPKGRRAVNQFFDRSEWTNGEERFQLVEYKIHFSDGHVHLHKVMAYNGHKNLDIFESDLSFPEINCDGERESSRECSCLEIKSDRTDSARHIDDRNKKKQKTFRNAISEDKNTLSVESGGVSQSVHKPMVFATLNDPFNATLACLTLVGGLITLVIAQYFATFAALPNGGLTSGTSVIGYVILMGLFFLFSSNFSFLLTPFVSTCIVRRFAVSFSYAMIFSGMLIKVWSSFREVTYAKPKTSKPWSLLAYLVAFTLFQGLISGLWLVLKPPSTDFQKEKWICYPPDGLDPHLILSMIYSFLLLFITIVLAIRTCSKSNNNEARWILISSSLVAIILSCWGIAIATGVWQIHRTPCTNLATATILLVCLYIPKIKMHLKLKKSMKAQGNTSPVPPEANKDCPVYATCPPPPFPVVFGYNMVTPAPVIPEEVIDPNHINQAYSLDESSETASTPFESSTYSDLEPEPYTFSTFLENPSTVNRGGQEDLLNDPTQMIPSSLYPLDMFNIEPIAITSDHCQPGTNEFTPPHRATSQLYLCPQSEWTP